MKVALKIEEIKCEGCINRIKNTLLGIKGVINSEFDLEKNVLLIEVKKEKITEKIIEKVNKLGFRAIRISEKNKEIKF